MGEDFDYAAEFRTLELDAVQEDIDAVMTDSKEWWPADYGHYGPFFIRMAWYSAGTYRAGDDRGGAGFGTQRFAPLNSWPDNANLDKARRLLWPIKQKYGRKISWADLLILTGNRARETMGFKTFGFAGGREDVWEPLDIYWVPEDKWLADNRCTGDRELDNPLGAVQMGLIYVNPEGPNGNPDPMASARDIRETFARMAMNDEETVALVAGGHTFGKTHGAADPGKYVGPEPVASGIEHQGFGWINSFNTGKGSDAISSGLEGAWTNDPIQWDNGYYDNLFGHEWELIRGPGGGKQGAPKNAEASRTVPDAHDPSKKHAPFMATTDIAMITDPAYLEISKRFHANPDQFADAFARAWYKLTHRDMGPITRYLGPLVPKEELLWQGPGTGRRSPAGLGAGRRCAEEQAAGVGPVDRATRGCGIRLGFELPRHRQARWRQRRAHSPRAAEGLGLQRPGRVADGASGAREGPAGLQRRAIRRQEDLARRPDRAGGGCAGVEQAAKNAGHAVQAPFTPGRSDASQEQTNVESFSALESTADGFRNYLADGHRRTAEELLIDRAELLTLTAPEMTVLVGGMRVLNANSANSSLGVLTDQPETLTNDFFVNLLDMNTSWKPAAAAKGLYEARVGKSDQVRWTGTRVDLLFGSNSVLRAIAEVYACSDAQQKFVSDFVAVWTKVMNLDRFDLA